MQVVQLLKSWEYKNVCMTTKFPAKVVQLLKSWEYKNDKWLPELTQVVVQLLKSWEYKNMPWIRVLNLSVVQLLKSWEYKNQVYSLRHPLALYSYLNLESTKTSNDFWDFHTHIVIIKSITVLVNPYFLKISVKVFHQMFGNILYGD